MLPPNCWDKKVGSGLSCAPGALGKVGKWLRKVTNCGNIVT